MSKPVNWIPALIALALLGFIILMANIDRLSGPPPDYSRYAIIHMPASGECPGEFRAVPVFIDKLGNLMHMGCVRNATAANGGMIDRLGPGEQIGSKQPLDAEMPKRPYIDPNTGALVQ